MNLPGVMLVHGGLITVFLVLISVAGV